LFVEMMIKKMSAVTSRHTTPNVIVGRSQCRHVNQYEYGYSVGIAILGLSL